MSRPEDPADDPVGSGASRQPGDLSPEAVDRAFAEMISGLQESTPVPWPGQKPRVGDGDGDSDGDSPDRTAAALGDDTPALEKDPHPAAPPVRRPTPGTLGGPRDFTVADPTDEDFEPPEPAALASADPLLLVAWGAAIGGPLAIVLLLILWQAAPAIVWVTLAVLGVLGWATVIWRSPSRRDPDDTGDGAVV